MIKLIYKIYDSKTAKEVKHEAVIHDPNLIKKLSEMTFMSDPVAVGGLKIKQIRYQNIVEMQTIKKKGYKEYERTTPTEYRNFNIKEPLFFGELWEVEYKDSYSHTFPQIIWKKKIKEAHTPAMKKWYYTQELQSQKEREKKTGFSDPRIKKYLQKIKEIEDLMESQEEIK